VPATGRRVLGQEESVWDRATSGMGMGHGVTAGVATWKQTRDWNGAPGAMPCPLCLAEAEPEGHSAKLHVGLAHVSASPEPAPI
jgi:hypothetical protein